MIWCGLHINDISFIHKIIVACRGDFAVARVSWGYNLESTYGFFFYVDVDDIFNLNTKEYGVGVVIWNHFGAIIAARAN